MPPSSVEIVESPGSFNDYQAAHPGYCDSVALRLYTQELAAFRRHQAGEVPAVDLGHAMIALAGQPGQGGEQ